jgi:KDO2-lipid IV(A) lauroyltransferase
MTVPVSLADRAETLLVRGLLGFFGAMSPVAASNFGGRMMRMAGPLMPSNRVVVENLRRALPEKTGAERRRIGRDAWENLGRVLAELVHLPAILEITEAGPGLEVEGSEHITAALLAQPPAIFFSAHLANWELLIPRGIRMGGLLAGIYRAPQRPGVDGLLNKMRHLGAGREFPMFRKGREGGRDALAHLRGGGKLAVLMDQKLNEGIAVPFFGRPAMTAPASARFALRFRCPVVPVHIERLGPARYRLVGEPRIELPATGNADEDALILTTRVNQIIERWIRARPGEWLWMHRRWSNEDSE